MYGTTKPPAGATPTAGAPIIPGSSIRAMLLALQKVAGRNYDPLLSRAGLTRYLTALPPADQSPAATEQEVAQLYTGVFQIPGEALTRLFHRNLGEAYATGILQNPAHQAMCTHIQAASREQQLALFAQETVRLIERAWPGMRLSEDNTAWYLTMDHCVICAGVQNDGAPICGQLLALVSGLAKGLLGRRLRVAEVECHALGASTCRFAIYKD